MKREDFAAFIPEDLSEEVGRIGLLPPQMGSCQVLSSEMLYKSNSCFRVCMHVCSPGPPKAMPGLGQLRWPEHGLWMISTLRWSSVPQTCSRASHPPEAPATPFIYKQCQKNRDQEQTARDYQDGSSSVSYSLGICHHSLPSTFNLGQSCKAEERPKQVWPQREGQNPKAPAMIYFCLLT